MANKLPPGLSGKHFMHPNDKSGMQTLLGLVTRSRFIKGEIGNLQGYMEEEYYLLNLAQNVKLGLTQGRSLYLLVHKAAETLGMGAPHVFLDNSPTIHSYSLGGKYPSIIFTSALIDTLPEPAVRTVIAHELGHLLCGHTFFRLLIENFDRLPRFANHIPVWGAFVSLGLQGLGRLLNDWYEKSELSADRAALLGTQDIESVQTTIMLLAGGSSKLATELTTSEFDIQVKEFQDKTESGGMGRIPKRMRGLFSDLAIRSGGGIRASPTARIREISSWAHSEQYAMLIAGDYASAAKMAET